MEKLQETGPHPETPIWGERVMCLGLRGHSGTTCPRGMHTHRVTLLFTHLHTSAHAHHSHIVNVPKPHKLVIDSSYRSVLSSHICRSLGAQAGRSP